MRLPVPSDSAVEKFRLLMREQRGLDLTPERAREAATRLLQDVWSTAAAQLDLEDGLDAPKGRIRRPLTIEEVDARAAGLFPKIAARRFREDVVDAWHAVQSREPGRHEYRP